MPRIRSLKPEFFDDEDLCALSPLHRLCYAGLWCQADKAGRLEDRPKRLKARVLPFDDVDIEQILLDLMWAGFILRYVVDGKLYIAIKPSSWKKHQRPRTDEPESQLPPIDARALQAEPIKSDEILSVQMLGKERKGKERNGRENAADVAASLSADVADQSSADVAEDTPDPSEQFGQAWNEATGDPIASCSRITAKRRRHIHARLAERPLTEWLEVFRRIQGSQFCRGVNERGWLASFEWVIGSADVAVKVLEGKYDDRMPAKKPKHDPNVAAAVDWYEECRTVHAQACGGDRYRHMTRMLDERAKAAS